MKIFIAKNGRQWGPYSLADLQKMVDAGTMKVNEMAWYEGQSDWIPLKDVPGFFQRAGPTPSVRRHAPSLEERRPILVWIFCLLTFFCTPFALWNYVHTIQFIVAEPDHLPGGGTLPDSLSALREQLVIPCAIAILGTVLDLTGAIFLFLLRKTAFDFFVGSLVIAMFGICCLLFSDGWTAIVRALGFLGFIEIAFSLAFRLAIIWYILRLSKKGVLR